MVSFRSSFYLASLTGERLRQVLADAEETEVHAAIPKFKGECSVTLNESLKAMGMTDGAGPDRPPAPFPAWRFR